MTHIPEPWLDAQANEQIVQLIAEKAKIDADLDSKTKELEARYADMVAKCQHMVVGVDQEDEENHVCLVCGAYSLFEYDDNRELLTDVESSPDRLILPVMSEVFSKISRYNISTGTIDWK